MSLALEKRDQNEGIEGGGCGSLDHARAETSAVIENCIECGGNHLIDALPAMGKSFGSIKAAHTTGKNVTYLTSRGNEESYAARAEHAESLGLDVKVLPSLNRDCPSARGDHGDRIQQRVTDLQGRGVSGKEIHKRLSLPCTDSGACEWSREWDFDTDDFDVLIGHYSHAYVPKVTRENRAVIIDEFPGAFETQFGGDPNNRDAPLPATVTDWVSGDRSPYDSYSHMIETRHSDDGRYPEHRRTTIKLIEGMYGEIEGSEGTDTSHAFETENGHASAPLVAYTILASEREGCENVNGVERVPLEAVTGHSGSVGLFDHAGKWSREGEPGVYILNPPKIESDTVIGVDGTPTAEMWDAAMGRSFENHQVLSDAERRAYIGSVDGLEIDLVGCTEHVRPYNNADNVNVEHDRAVIDHIRDRHDEKPGLVTTQTAMDTYAENDLLPAFDLLPPENPDPGDDREHTIYYGNVLGSNKYENKSVGFVSGSTNFGDGFVEKWGAYINESVVLPDRDSKESWSDVSEGGLSGILAHMRENQTLQSILRFGRQGEGATVYVNTSAVPDWIKFDREFRVRKLSNGMGETVSAIVSLSKGGSDSITAKDVTSVESVEIETQRTRRCLDDLAGRDLLDKTPGAGPIDPTEYQTTDLERLVETTTGPLIEYID